MTPKITIIIQKDITDPGSIINAWGNIYEEVDWENPDLDRITARYIKPMLHALLKRTTEINLDSVEQNDQS